MDDLKGKEVDFKVTMSRPPVVEVTLDGVRYLIKMGVAVLSVVDAERTGDNGLPVFNVAANQAMSVSLKDPPAIVPRDDLQ